MKHLTNLFRIAQITRSQPQYGYALSGMQQDDMSNLSEHHYLVTFIGWQLARNLKEKGANIDVERVIELCLVHDLGELFGSDIAMPYARINPKARELAKAFEEENQRFLSGFFGSQSGHVKELMHDTHVSETDEACVAKIADYLEVTHFKQYMKDYNVDTEIALVAPSFEKMIGKIKDPIAKRELTTFIASWKEDIKKKDLIELLKEGSN